MTLLRITILLLILVLTACQSTRQGNSDLTKSGNSHVSDDIVADYMRLPKMYKKFGFSSCSLDKDSLQTLLDVHSGKLLPNNQLSYSVRNVPLSIREINSWGAIVNRIESATPPALLSPHENRHVFFAIFDGTWNDRDKSGEKTIPAKLSEQLEELAKGDSKYTVKYYPGVGTRTSFIKRIFEGIFGRGTKKNAEGAYEDLQELIDDKNGILPHVYAIGFSRGAASARHFLNTVDESYSVIQVPKGRLLADARLYALLFDTVATGQHTDLQLQIPENMTSVLHLVAESEQRELFPVVRINKPLTNDLFENRFVEIDLPGTHSDIGGGYGDKLEGLTYYLSLTWLENQGVFLTTEKPNFLSSLNFGKNDSRYLKIGEPRQSSSRQEVSLFSVNDVANEPVQEIDRVLSADFESELAELATETDRALEIAALSASGALQKFQRSKLSASNVFNGLVLQMSLRNNELTIQTNCPEKVSFNVETGFIEILNQPFRAITNELIDSMEESLGIIETYPVLDRLNFIKAQ